jgi:hypothetical protein
MTDTTFLAASTDVKQAFLHGGLTVSKMHHLSDRSVMSATVLGSWAKFPEFVPKSEIIDLFREKSRRPKVKKAHEGIVVE